MGFRGLSQQIVTGFLVSFFANYQPQIATETRRFSVFVALLLAIAITEMALRDINKITARRFFRLKTFLLTVVTVLQTGSVWTLIALISKPFNETLESVFNFEAIFRLLIGVLFVGGLAALLETPPKEPAEGQTEKKKP